MRPFTRRGPNDKRSEFAEGNNPLFDALVVTEGKARASHGYPNARPGSISAERAARQQARARGDLGGIWQRWRAKDGTLHRTAKDAGPGATLRHGVQHTDHGEFRADNDRVQARVVKLPWRLVR